VTQLAGWRLRPDRRLRTLAGGTVLLGGSPLRVLTLTAGGGERVAAWWRGEPVGAGDGERRLARRLIDGGLAHPEPPDGTAPGALTVVVPVRDRPRQLRRCLAALGTAWPVIVIDDGSAEPEAIAAAAAAAGARVLRRERSGGPAAARNAGLAAVATPFVAFVDSDCVVGAGFPGRLLAHLADPAVAVVAPRIVALEPPDGMLAAFEVHHSALDMGAHPALVRPGTAVSYAPSAVLVARREALGDGFDEALTVGEDVDLLWRLHDGGWDVRYDPDATVAHDHRVRARGWFLRRLAYDSSTAPLARRHPGRLPAFSISRFGLGFWAAALSGHPLVAAGIAGVGVAGLRRKLGGRVPGAWGASARLVAEGQLTEGRFLSRALAAPWLPFLLAATAARPRALRRTWGLIAAVGVWEWSRERHEPTPVHYLLPRAAADVARCAGVWLGCLRERSPAALRPQIRADDDAPR
jgi:mycofactocin system glycosyltransferase